MRSEKSCSSYWLGVACLVFLLSAGSQGVASLQSQLTAAGENRAELERALNDVPVAQRAGMEFLIENMPQRDLQQLSAEFLLENCRLAYESRKSDSWAKSVPLELFHNDVLPYASISECRDRWRADFRRRFLPVVSGAKSASEATVRLNHRIFKQLNVKYSTKRERADQSPFESIESGLASCTGLSILLVDACRSVGIPARLVGTPLWSDGSGNHTWVEVWDDGWHFTGAAEPTDDRLDDVWFLDRTSTANADSAQQAIYAMSFRKTPIAFPCVWDDSVKYVSAINVTDRYIKKSTEAPVGFSRTRIVVRDMQGSRIAARVSVRFGSTLVFEGITNDESADTNDHLSANLQQGRKYAVTAESREPQEGRTCRTSKIVTVLSDGNSIELTLPPMEEAFPPDVAASQSAVEDLLTFLSAPDAKLDTLADRPFARVALIESDSVSARTALAEARLKQVRRARAVEMEAMKVVVGAHTMQFSERRFGDAPMNGHSLYISLHGGGNAPAEVNDEQWKNQQRLYKLSEGIYVAPRAPGNTWDLWHQASVGPLLDRLIENYVAFRGVNRDRVYLLGYSAGGDGVYQLAARMPDRFAAAAAMAGHPNETSLLGLRNLPFSLQMGRLDGAYDRNKVAQKWQQALHDLHAADAEGYQHFVKIHADKQHWMDGEDKVALPWMAKWTRQPTPNRVVWVQDNVTERRCYWLGVSADHELALAKVTAAVAGQLIRVESDDLDELIVFLDDRFIDLDQPITIKSGEDAVLFSGYVPRTIESLNNTLSDRGDEGLSFPATKTVQLQQKFPEMFVRERELLRYDAVRVKTAPKIDGKLDEPCWTSAKKTTPFVDLISGQPATHNTQAAIRWDDDFLYVGYWLDEPNVYAKYLERDDPIYNDNDIELFIAGQDTYYEFEMNAHGTVYEAFFVWDDAYEKGNYAKVDPQLAVNAPKSEPFNGVGFTRHPRGPRTIFLDYDFPGFQSAVHVDGTLNDDSDVDRGWTVELAFPWSGMKSLARGDSRAIPPNANDAWRINVFRFNKYKAPAPARGSGGWSFGKHGVWDSHIPEVFPIVSFVE